MPEAAIDKHNHSLLSKRKVRCPGQRNVPAPPVQFAGTKYRHHTQLRGAVATSADRAHYARPRTSCILRHGFFFLATPSRSSESQAPISANAYPRPTETHQRPTPGRDLVTPSMKSCYHTNVRPTSSRGEERHRTMPGAASAAGRVWLDVRLQQSSVWLWVVRDLASPS